MIIIESSRDTLRIILLFTLSILLQFVVDTGFKGKRLSTDAAYSPLLSTRHHALDVIDILPLFISVNTNLRQYFGVIC